jgi:hypothetical protein
MKDGKPSSADDRDDRRPSSGGRRGTGRARKRNFVDRATAQGHSGYGSESVRPHLRDQLKLKALLPHPFPTEDGPPADEPPR